MKALIVEDEPKVALLLKEGLEANGFEAEIAYDGMIGKILALRNEYDVLILDVMMPGINGFELCKLIKKEKPLQPVIMLTALGNTDDVMLGFDSGADDYLKKPFEFRELLARINALMKRKSKVNRLVNSLASVELTIDRNEKTAWRNNKKILLTAKEFALLEYLMNNKGKVLSRSDIAENVWGINFDTETNVVDVYVNFLRKKLDKGYDKQLIQTRVGMGYIFNDD